MIKRETCRDHRIQDDAKTPEICTATIVRDAVHDFRTKESIQDIAKQVVGWRRKEEKKERGNFLPNIVRRATAGQELCTWRIPCC